MKAYEGLWQYMQVDEGLWRGLRGYEGVCKCTLYFPIAHNALCLPPKFCIIYCCEINSWQLKHPEEGSNAETSVNLYRHLASLMNILTFTCRSAYSQEHFKTIVYAKFGGQTEYIKAETDTTYDDFWRCTIFRLAKPAFFRYSGIFTLVRVYM